MFPGKMWHVQAYTEKYSRKAQIKQVHLSFLSYTKKNTHQIYKGYE